MFNVTYSRTGRVCCVSNSVNICWKRKEGKGSEGKEGNREGGRKEGGREEPRLWKKITEKRNRLRERDEGEKSRKKVKKGRKEEEERKQKRKGDPEESNFVILDTNLKS